MKKSIRRIATFLLMAAMLMQMITVIFMLADYYPFNIGELHEICGFIIFALIFIHIFFFGKSLRATLRSHKQQ